MRSTCPHCGSTNEYEPHPLGVVCVACRRPFAPTSFVTEASDMRAKLDADTSAFVRDDSPQAARDRLLAYTRAHPTQMDHDRDIVLVAIYDMLTSRD